MSYRINSCLLIIFLFLLFQPMEGSGFGDSKFDLVIIGGGASGTTAGIHSARMGVETLIVEKTNWLGGMLTSAGVSAIDGNHNLPGGIWGEFRNKLYDYYGGPEQVETGWVSNTLFEPSVGNMILQDMAKIPQLEIWYNSDWKAIERVPDGWKISIQKADKVEYVYAKRVIDATELGDVLAEVGVSYDVGMNSRKVTGETIAPEESNDIIQDLTYVVVLEDFGEGNDATIPRPEGYDPKEFECACDISDPSVESGEEIDCQEVITYGKLPNNKYMINWPKCGNDFYLNLINKSPKEREEALEEAKLHSLRFVYFLQTELGFSNLGIAENEFPTVDGLPMIPYHRESRLMKGKARLTLNHLLSPFDQDEAYYRTGIAVGDYPIDHHHAKNPEAPEINFFSQRVPSYNVPLGALIPAKVEDFIVAEKSISVTNIVNGATRLQPVVLQIGQAAGALAAISILKDVTPGDVSVREVQSALLDAGGYIVPYIDVKPNDPHFKIIQRIGATGILKAYGMPYKWANQTWFYPDRAVSEYELVEGLKPYYKELNSIQGSGQEVTMEFLVELINKIDPELKKDKLLSNWNKGVIQQKLGISAHGLSRRSVSVILDKYLNPFSKEIDHNGHVLEKDRACKDQQ